MNIMNNLNITDVSDKHDAPSDSDADKSNKKLKVCSLQPHCNSSRALTLTEPYDMFTLLTQNSSEVINHSYQVNLYKAWDSELQVC